MKKVLYTVLFFLLAGTTAYSQADVSFKFGKGFRVKSADGKYYMKMGVRVQPRWDFITDVETGQFEQQAWIARGRLKFDGHLLTTDLRYKIEFDVVGGYVRDALIKYRFGKHFDVWFGQGKLPGNRERVVSSGSMQFVNRSIVNNGFNIDRDVGIQLHHFFNIGEVIVRDYWAISTGNGIKNKRFKSTPSFTGKIEVLPLGNFKGKGDYISADLEREQTMKMAIAFSADYNPGAYKSHSHIGSYLDEGRNLLTLNADILLKYKGWSFMSEFGYRKATDNSPLLYDADNNVYSAFYTGWGLSTQSGYIFPNNWEISLRYAFTEPEKLTNGDDKPIVVYSPQTDHTLGISKYIIGHKLKVQADVTYRLIDGQNDLVIARLQMEIHL